MAPVTNEPTTAEPATGEPTTGEPTLATVTSVAVTGTASVDSVTEPTTKSPATPEELYYNLWWAELPPLIQEAYSKLLVTETSWDSGLSTEIDDYDWIDLSEEQREAALFIGYTEELWCADEDGGCDAFLNADANAVMVRESALFNYE